ncbi:methylornithine synthase PylB [Chloroflexota bacterium]
MNYYYSLEKLLNKAATGVSLSKAEIIYLLALSRDEEIAKLFEVARELRHRYFGDKVFLYGFLYFSTWCRNKCNFCYYRHSNSLCKRYRKTNSQLLKAAADLTQSGVHLLDLTMGEDPFYYNKEYGFEPLLNLVKRIKKETCLPIMISFGATPDEVLRKLPEVGADWYACYQETYNEKIYRQLRPGQSFGDRLEKKYKAVKLGLLIEEGILTGVGESLTDIGNSMEAMSNIGAHQVRVMSFIPQRGTPMSDFPPPPQIRELVIIAVLRLLFPHRLIPASLDVHGINGLKQRLEAGANVVTSLILPHSEMMGVAQSTLNISEGYRTVKGITPVLNKLGLTKAGLDDYISWIDCEKKTLINKYYFSERYIV